MHRKVRLLRTTVAACALLAAWPCTCRAWQYTETARPNYQVRYYPSSVPQVVAPQPPTAPAANYNPVGFGFGGYSYGSYPAYGYNAYLPSAYAGFNTPGVAGPAPGGRSYYRASDVWNATIGPDGARLQYRAP